MRAVFIERCLALPTIYYSRRVGWLTWFGSGRFKLGARRVLSSCASDMFRFGSVWCWLGTLLGAGSVPIWLLFVYLGYVSVPVRFSVPVWFRVFQICFGCVVIPVRLCFVCVSVPAQVSFQLCSRPGYDSVPVRFGFKYVSITFL